MKIVIIIGTVLYLILTFYSCKNIYDMFLRNKIYTDTGAITRIFIFSFWIVLTFLMIIYLVYSNISN